MELIERQAAIDAIEKNAYRHTYLDQIIDIIKALPTAQPEIIRCKDCKHYRAYAGIIDGHCYMAEWYKRYQYENDFCSRAERREDETNRCGRN